MDNVSVTESLITIEEIIIKVEEPMIKNTNDATKSPLNSIAQHCNHQILVDDINIPVQDTNKISLPSHNSQNEIKQDPAESSTNSAIRDYSSFESVFFGKETAYPNNGDDYIESSIYTASLDNISCENEITNIIETDSDGYIQHYGHSSEHLSITSEHTCNISIENYNA